MVNAQSNHLWLHDAFNLDAHVTCVSEEFAEENSTQLLSCNIYPECEPQHCAQFSSRPEANRITRSRGECRGDPLEA